MCTLRNVMRCVPINAAVEYSIELGTVAIHLTEASWFEGLQNPTPARNELSELQGQ